MSMDHLRFSDFDNETLYNLAHGYQYGNGPECDWPLAVEIYRELMRRGYGPGFYGLGNC